jgi:hypothetical protein
MGHPVLSCNTFTLQVTSPKQVMLGALIIGLSFLQASYPPQRRDSSSTSSIEDSRVIQRSWLKLLVNPSLRTTIVIGWNANVVSCWLLLSRSHSPSFDCSGKIKICRASTNQQKSQARHTYKVSCLLLLSRALFGLLTHPFGAGAIFQLLVLAIFGDFLEDSFLQHREGFCQN